MSQSPIIRRFSFMLPVHWQRKSKLKKTSLKRRYAISGHFTFANLGDISKWSRYFSFPLYTKSSKSHLRKISPIVHVWMRKPWSYFASKLDQRGSIWQGSDRFCHNPVENVQRLSGRSSPLRVRSQPPNRLNIPVSLPGVVVSRLS